MMKKFAVAGVLSVLMLAMAAPAFAQSYRGSRCKNCPAPRPHYDSQEVVRTTRDIDRSRVINTYSVVPVRRKVRTTNHLVIRDNTIRNVGVIRHNHTIIEKEIRYKRRVPAPPVVINFVQQRYITVHRPATIKVDAPIIYPRHRVLRVRG
jgi:hypothetical protein